MFRFICPYKFLYIFGFHQSNIFHCMACNKSILADHDWKHNIFVLRNTVCLNKVIIGFLIVFCINLNPSGISCSHTVGMLAVDIQRTGQRTVDYCHAKRQTIGSGHIKHFPHQSKSARGSCCQSTRSRCTDRGTHGTVFTFYRNKFRINLAIGDKIGYKLWKFR